MPHNHKCSCDHEDVKFCKCCNTVYCKGCNQEWSARSNYNYGWLGGWNQTVPQITYCGTTSTIGKTVPSGNTLTGASSGGVNLTTLYKSACDHKVK